MKNKAKTKVGLIKELEILEQRITKLQKPNKQRKKSSQELKKDQLHLEQFAEKGTTVSQESKDLLDKIVNLSPDWIFVKDKNYRHIMVNEGYASGVGKSVEDIIGKNDIEIGFPKELIFGNPDKGITGFRNDDKRALKGETIHNEYDPAIAADGTLHIFDTYKAPIRDSNIQESENRFKELFNHMSSGVAVYEAKDNGKDFIIKDFNQAGEKIDKTNKEDIIGKSVLKAFPGVKDFGLFKAFQEVYKTGKPQHHPITFYKDQRIDGWRENYIYKLPSGEIVTVYDDITERKKVEEETRWKTEDLTISNALNNAVNRGDSLLEILQLLARETKRIFSCHGETVYLLSEDREYLVMKIFTRPPAMISRVEKLIGIRIPAISIPLKTGSLYRKTLQEGKPQLINDPKAIQGLMAEFTENKMLKKLIPKIYSILDTRSVMNIPLISKGEALGLLEVSRKEPFTEFDLKRFKAISEQLTSIIEHKQAEETLKESRQLLNKTERISKTGGWEYDVQSQKTTWTDEVYRIYEVPFDYDINIEKEIAFYKPEDQLVIERYFKNAIKEGESYDLELQFITAKGKHLWVRTIGSPVQKNGKTIKIIGNIQDITERKNTLREIEELAKFPTENPNPVLRISKDGIVLFRNHASKPLLESWEYKEGKPLQDRWFQFVFDALEDDDIKTVEIKIGDKAISLTFAPIVEKDFVNVYGLDITERKQVEERIEKIQSLRNAITDINQLLVRVKSESELYQEICNFLIKVKEIKFVWIGLTNSENFEVKPVAQAGFEEDYLSSIKVTWDDSKYGNGPTGIALKTSQPFIMRNIEDDPKFKPWKNDALKRGYLSSIALPLIYEEETIGVLNVYSGIKDAFTDEVVKFLKEVSEDITIGIRSLRLGIKLQQSYHKLQKTMDATIETMSKIIEVKDPYTAGHQQRVSQLATAIAKELNLSPDKIEVSDIEFSLIKEHSQIGYDILKAIDFSYPVAQIVLQHHEKIDGSGYPRGLKRDKILLEAKIICVADVVEAMSSHRPYRPALGIDAALEEISKNRGILYDPEIVDVCLRLFKEKGFKFE